MGVHSKSDMYLVSEIASAHGSSLSLLPAYFIDTSLDTPINFLSEPYLTHRVMFTCSVLVVSA